MRKMTLVGILAALVAALIPATGAQALPIDPPARDVEPVVLTGAQLPTWSHPAATGLANHYPSGAGDESGLPPGADYVRDAHNGTLVAPSDSRPGAVVEQIAAFSWDGVKFVEIRVQVDQRFPYFLANGRSGFAFYSGTDEELTYEWDVESWKKQFTEITPQGTCEARYAKSIEEVQTAIDEGWMTLGADTTLESMLKRTTDPVRTLDDDDEIVFMASDAGSRAPLDANPPGAVGGKQQIAVTDPRDPANVRYVYLVQREGGSSFNASNGYVNYQRDPNADEWVDQNTFSDADPEKLSASNGGYGPNIHGLVCSDDPDTLAVEGLDNPETLVVEEPRQSNDRIPRDGLTVSTDAYKWHASGRWMIRSMQIISAATGEYGPDLIDRWKGRAFQQSPDSFVSLVGFEDEQVNWEANSALLGERMGPVRAIRETWGADSGTNVTKTETFYRDAVTYRFRVRVHPIPPDGLYTSWDYNQGVAQCYFNESHNECVHVDGINDDALNVDEVPVTGQPAFFDATDPTQSKPLANLNWEQVSGVGDTGSLVYMFEMKNAQAAENPLVVPYYRDDACLDDGTGDNPTPRQYPGETSTDPRVYSPENRTCTINSANPLDPATNNWQNRQGCFACHGIHYFITSDTDNATMPKPMTEIDGQQWQWAVPTASPLAVGDAYANTLKTPLVAVATYLP